MVQRRRCKQFAHAVDVGLDQQVTGVEMPGGKKVSFNSQAVGLPRVDDPTAAVQSRADAESVVRSKALIDFGFDVED